MSATIVLIAPSANSTPARPPMTDSSTLSVSS
jgi:hypothetical protein